MVIPSEPPNQAGRILFERLNISKLKSDLLLLTKEINILLKCSNKELSNIFNLYNLKILRQQLSLDVTLINWMDNDKISKILNFFTSSINLSSIYITGIFTVVFLYQFSGSFSIVELSWLDRFYKSVIQKIPFLWFLIFIVITELML